MIISTALKPLFRILQITCLAPFNLTKTNKFYKSYFMMFYSIVLILMSLSVLTSVTFKRYSILETDVFISGNIMSVVHLIGIWISHLITLIESLIKRRQQIEFLEKLREIDYIFEKRIGYNFKYKSLQRSIIFHMIGWGSLYTLLESYLFILLLDVDYKFGRFLRNWAIHMIPFSFCCLRYFQVITYVLFLKLRFKFLNKSLVETKHEIENLTLLKSVYSKLWNLSNLINQSFGLSILINIATNFISITINFYFVFLSLKMNHNPKDILEALWSYGDILWLIPYLLNVFMLAKVCHATADIGNNAAAIVQDVKHDERDNNFNSFIHKFILQLIHQRIVFTAGGFFIVDYTLLFTLVGAGTTYLIILIQFHLGEEQVPMTNYGNSTN